ncbi:hypothetical protein SDC9_146119 [bioreactor metagenome]|uniref:Uncharacterized protein n=1 Tax=bioreactor metagenome TaxID=1076179 RepID=A0A645EC78_9ZZZZ
MGLSGFKLPAYLHEEHSVVPLTYGFFPLVGGEVRITVLQFLSGDEEHIPVRVEGEGGVGFAQVLGGVADGSHNGAHGVFEILEVPVLPADVLFPVPLVHVHGVEVVHLLISADGIHIGIEAGPGLELIPLQRQTLPLGQRVDHLPVSAHVRNVEGHGAFHAVEIVVQARSPVHKQGGGDPVEVQPLRQVLLKIRVNEFDGALELVVGQRHFVPGGNHYFTHWVTHSF